MRIAPLPEPASYPTAARAADAGTSSTSIAIRPAVARFQKRMNPKRNLRARLIVTRFRKSRNHARTSGKGTGPGPGRGAAVPNSFPPVRRRIQMTTAGSLLYPAVAALRPSPALYFRGPRATPRYRVGCPLRLQTTKAPRTPAFRGISPAIHQAARSKCDLPVRLVPHLNPRDIPMKMMTRTSKREVPGQTAGRRARRRFHRGHPDDFVRHGRQTCSVRHDLRHRSHHHADGSEIPRDWQAAQGAWTT